MDRWGRTIAYSSSILTSSRANISCACKPSSSKRPLGLTHISTPQSHTTKSFARLCLNTHGTSFKKPPKNSRNASVSSLTKPKPISISDSFTSNSTLFVQAARRKRSARLPFMRTWVLALRRWGQPIVTMRLIFITLGLCCMGGRQSGLLQPVTSTLPSRRARTTSLTSTICGPSCLPICRATSRPLATCPSPSPSTNRQPLLTCWGLSACKSTAILAKPSLISRPSSVSNGLNKLALRP